MIIKKLVLASLVLSAYIPGLAEAQSYPGGTGVGTISACPTLPALEGMSFDIILGPGESSSSSFAINYATLDGVVFGPPCDIFFAPPSTLYIECGPHQAQLSVAITPFAVAGSTRPTSPQVLSGPLF